MTLLPTSKAEADDRIAAFVTGFEPQQMRSSGQEQKLQNRCPQLVGHRSILNLKMENAMTDYSDYETPFASAIRRSRNLLIAIGIVMILAGTAAIMFPYFSTLGVTVCVGVMFIVAGIAQGIGAFSLPKWTGVLLGLVFAVLGLIAGGYLLARPLQGVFALTVVVAAVFLVDGIFKAVISFQMRPLAGWGWVLFDGITSVVLGGLLWWQLPSSALWALGVLAGVRIIVSGWTLVMVPIAVGRLFDSGSSMRNAV